MGKINKKPEIGEFIYKAEELINKRDYEGSLKICNKMLDAHPKCEEALLIKAECLFHLEKLEDSLDCSKTLLEINPSCDQAHRQVAGIMFAVGDYDNALKSIDKALKIYSDSFDSIMMKAQILYQLNDSSYKKWIGKARKIDPKRTENFMENFWIKEEFIPYSLIALSDSIGEINDLMSKREFKKAIDVIDKIIDLEMKQGMREVIYSMKIECLICLKDYREAEKFIRELIDLNKDYPMAYFHRAVIKFNTLYFREALDELNKCIEVAEKVDMRHPQYYFLKAQILKKFNDNSYKDFEKAAKEVEKENIERFKSLIKESGMNIRDFKKEFGIK